MAQTKYILRKHVFTPASTYGAIPFTCERPFIPLGLYSRNLGTDYLVGGTAFVYALWAEGVTPFAPGVDIFLSGFNNCFASYERMPQLLIDDTVDFGDVHYPQGTYQITPYKNNSYPFVLGIKYCLYYLESLH